MSLGDQRGVQRHRQAGPPTRRRGAEPAHEHDGQRDHRQAQQQRQRPAGPEHVLAEQPGGERQRDRVHGGRNAVAVQSSWGNTWAKPSPRARLRAISTYCHASEFGIQSGVASTQYSTRVTAPTATLTRHQVGGAPTRQRRGRRGRRGPPRSVDWSTTPQATAAVAPTAGAGAAPRTGVGSREALRTLGRCTQRGAGPERVDGPPGAPRARCVGGRGSSAGARRHRHACEPAPVADSSNATAQDPRGWFEAGRFWYGDFGDPQIVRVGATYYAYSSPTAGQVPAGAVLG